MTLNEDRIIDMLNYAVDGVSSIAKAFTKAGYSLSCYLKLLSL